MKTPDITYKQDGMFTRFYAETEAGNVIWNEMAKQMDGVAAVLNFEAAGVIAQIRKAGYKVAKAKLPEMTIEEILAELEA